VNFTGLVRPVAYVPRPIRRYRCGRWPGQPMAPARPPRPARPQAGRSGLPPAFGPVRGTAGHRARPSPISHSSVT